MQITRSCSRGCDRHTCSLSLRTCSSKRGSTILLLVCRYCQRVRLATVCLCRDAGTPSPFIFPCAVWSSTRGRWATWRCAIRGCPRPRISGWRHREQPWGQLWRGRWGCTWELIWWLSRWAVWNAGGGTRPIRKLRGRRRSGR